MLTIEIKTFQMKIEKEIKNMCEIVIIKEKICKILYFIVLKNWKILKV